MFFFFFKQKTAYEMRISDWSSDVCSSDLAFLGHHHARAPDLVFRHIDVAAFLAEAVGHVYLLEAGRDLAAVLQAQLAVEQRHLWRGEAARQVEIGRASCREGRCMYV